MPGIVPKASIASMIAPKPAPVPAPAGKVARLHLNEGALGPSPKAMAAMRDAAGRMHQYPGVDASGLSAALARRHGIDPHRNVLGCGSDELIQVLCLAFLEPGDEAIHTQYGFVQFPIATRIAGGAVMAAAMMTGAVMAAAAVLEALACWGQEIDLAIIESALTAPAQAERLAGLALLTFRSRSLSTDAFLTLTQPLLSDLRAEVVIATLRLLQRRQEPEVLAVLDSCIDADQLPGVAETAIQALGCISSHDSCRLLIARLRQLEHTPLEHCIRRQLQAQVRPRTWLEQQLREQNLTL